MINLDEIVANLDRAWEQEKNLAKKNITNLISNQKKEIKNNKNQIDSNFIQNISNNDAPELIEEAIESRKSKSLIEKVELEGRRDFFRLRKIWSRCIIIWISIFIIFHGGIALAVGFGYLNYQDHHSILLTILAEDFLQILGMGYIVVKFLYPVTKNF